MGLSHLLLFFCFVTASHFVFLAAKKTDENRERLWSIHYSINGILWIILFAGIVLFQFRSPHVYFPIHLKVVGLFLFCIGMFLVYKSGSLLGLKNAMGYRFFYPQSTQSIHYSLFKYLKNPMYDGFLLILVGLYLLLGIVENLWIALSSFILLNVILASLENFSPPHTIKDLF